MGKRQKINRSWSDYPIGTIAHEIMGDYWTRVKYGWKWCDGATFPTPGAGCISVTLPNA